MINSFFSFFTVLCFNRYFKFFRIVQTEIIPVNRECTVLNIYEEAGLLLQVFVSFIKIHQQNTRCFAARLTKDLINNFDWDILIFIHYNLDLASHDYHLLFYMKDYLSREGMNSTETFNKDLHSVFKSEDLGTPSTTQEQ